ncbi:MAG TPA: hypothetical protein VGF25_22300 [Thermoleophilaceae bacterium]|jgi:hypothetical protein
MPDLIAVCGFLGAWLLVIGPLGQAVRELEEEEFERDSFARAEQQVEKPPPVSAWWWLAPPAYFVLRRRRDRVYHQRIAVVMRPEELEAFAHLRDVANAWGFVAAGASLIAAKETWELHEQYDWADWTFWALVGVMLLICAARVAFRTQRQRPRRS